MVRPASISEVKSAFSRGKVGLAYVNNINLKASLKHEVQYSNVRPFKGRLRLN